jgi:hypothetical protein
MEIALKDVAIAVIGGAAGIAAILLVFVAFVVGRADSLPETTPDKVIKKYTRIAKLGFVPLIAQVLTVFTAYWWLFRPASCTLLVLWKYGFPIALLGFLLYAAWVFWIL